MLFLYASVLLAIDWCYAAVICDCGKPGSTIKMKEVDYSKPEAYRCFVFKFEVTESTSINTGIMINMTTFYTFRCPNGTMYTETRVCSKEFPNRCMYFNKDDCKKVGNSRFLGNLLGVLLGGGGVSSTTTESCQNPLCPGHYEQRLTDLPVQYECEPVTRAYENLIMADGKEVGCYRFNLASDKCSN